MANRVGTKGQIVIDKAIRDKLGIEPGWKAFQRIVDGHVEINFNPPEHKRSLAGMLAHRIKRSIANEDWNEVREKAWAEEIEEDWELNKRANAEADKNT
jgi:AbrB family looped-hinge helix DNA binding protein